MGVVLAVVVPLAMLACLALIPFGLPGLWLVAAGVLVLALFGQLGWTFALIAAGAVLLVEVAELVTVKRLGEAYGGSNRAFWGAVAGGMAGLFVGVPVPLVGPVITAFLGTFLGAAAVTLVETRSLGRSARVGWGVVLARTLAVGMKVGTGLALTVAVGFALLG